MPLQWTEDLVTQISTIDNQHQEIMGRMNRFHDACRQAQGRDELPYMLDFLIRYVERHFLLEESYMQRYSYPGLALHKDSHDYFRRKVHESLARLDAQGPRFDVLIGMNYLIGDWWRDHILSLDKAMASFLRDQSVADMAPPAFLQAVL